jgi:hypothetical protein
VTAVGHRSSARSLAQGHGPQDVVEGGVQIVHAAIDERVEKLADVRQTIASVFSFFGRKAIAEQEGLAGVGGDLRLNLANDRQGKAHALLR